MRPNYTRGCDKDGHTPPFLKDIDLMSALAMWGRGRIIRQKSPEKIGKCRRCDSRCHVLCEMMSMDSGMLPDLAVPRWKENLYERSFGTGC
jgi:hypothetical protein